MGPSESCRDGLSPLVCHGKACGDVIKDLYPLGHWRESTLWSNSAEVLCTPVSRVIYVL